MSSDRPDNLVSTLICTRNRPSLLRRAVESVLAQTWTHLEIVIVDDGSDPGLEYDFSDPRVRVVYQRPHVGIPAARNIAISHAWGEFLCLLDDDDYYLPRKLETQVNFLLEHPAVDMVFSRIRTIGAGAESVYPRKGHVHNALTNLLSFNVIHTNATMFRRRVIEKVRFDERLTKYDDTQFHLAVSQRCNVAYLPVVVAVWRKRWSPSQVSAPDPGRTYRNFKIICEVFRDAIRERWDSRLRYYGRLAFQALRCGSVRGAISALRKMLT